MSCADCEIVQLTGSPVMPIRTVTGANVDVLGCRKHDTEVLGVYTLGLGLMAGNTIGRATGAGPDEANALIAAAADILRGGEHEGCTGPKVGGCRAHLAAYDARAARLRNALAALTGPVESPGGGTSAPGS